MNLRTTVTIFASSIVFSYLPVPTAADEQEPVHARSSAPSGRQDASGNVENPCMRQVRAQPDLEW